MAVSRDKLAEALAYEQAKRQRLAEYIPTVAGPQSAPSQNLRTDLENLSAGLGQGIVNQLEGVKGLITDPVGTAKGAYEAVRGIVRDPKVLAQALAETGRKAMSGPLGAGEVVGEMLGPMRGKPPMAEIDVYHGSPHRFEPTEENPLGEFDASKIGTGEGAQAYGHGIYLAESPKVAKEYATKLGRVVSSIDNNPTKDVYEEWAVSALKNFPEPEKAKAYFQNLVDVGLLKGKGSNEVRAYVSSVNDAIDKAAGKKVGQAIQGNLYTADLPDEMVDRMLDYDLPINQQNPYVLSALDRAGINTQSTALAGPMAQGQEKHLAKFGIPGIKYMDEGSRGYVVDLFHKGKPYAEHSGVKHQTLQSAQQRIAEAEAAGFEPRLGTRGTRNFVVFPGEEKKVKILERNGEKLANALKEQKPSPIQSYGVMGYPTDVLRREKQNFNSQYGLEEGKQFTKDYEVVNIDELRPTEKIEEKKVQSLMRTMREEGNSQDNPIPPIIVDSEGNILDGHNRYEAAKRIGAKQIPIIELYDYKTGSRFSE